MIDYIAVSGTKTGRVIEYVDHLHEHFLDPCIIHNAAYMPPSKPGFSIEMKPESIAQYTFKAERPSSALLASTNRLRARHGPVSSSVSCAETPFDNGAPIRTERMIITGRLDVARFLPWIRRHSAKLGIHQTVDHADEARIELTVMGRWS